MCGIAGIHNFNNKPVNHSLIKKMIGSIAHRGPDGKCSYINGSTGLGHCRLAIIDLTTAGSQPMNNGSLWISYNGEVYNFRKLKKQLKKDGIIFNSKTDTEVVLKSFQKWGDDIIKKFNGMFAFAIWDETKKELTLARDRYGIKPLYYYKNGNSFIFASEIKALLQHPAIKPNVCLEALKEYFIFQNIFSDKTFFSGIKTLPPGHILKISNEKIKIIQYWDFQFKPQKISFNEAQEALKHKLSMAVKRQMISDVPIGGYLGGGMDSGTITAFAAPHYRGRFKTFTAGFDLSLANDPIEQFFDERESAELITNKFQTEAYQLIIRSGDLEKVLPKLIYHIEDPRLGMSYQNYHIADLASRFVKVVFDGAGGDEIFGGYPWRYNIFLNQGINAYYDYWQRLVKEKELHSFFRKTIFEKIKDYRTEDIFKLLLSKYTGLNSALYFESKTFLQGLLSVLDKIGMAHSLETRLPLLDNDLVDFSLTLPPEYKINISETADNGCFNSRGGKKIMRQAMANILPDQITKSQKRGFSVPDASWYRTKTLPYIRSILLNPNSAVNHYFQPTFIETALQRHLSGKANNRLLIWSLLNFEWWHRTFIDSS